MTYFVLLFLEIVALFLLSRRISKVFSKVMSINFLSFLFLPGIIIHELSHMLIAVILFVPVGDMEFTPKKSDNGLKLGSVEIAKTDPIRRSIIGFAPVFVGLIIILGIVYLFTSNILFFKDKEVYIFAVAVAGFIYLLFAVSNTMFSSRADMEGTIEILIALLVIFILVFAFGFCWQLSFEKILTKDFFEVIRKSTIDLLVQIVIDLCISGMIKLFRR